MDINCFSVFLGQSPMTTEIKEKINKCDLIKLPCFSIAKEIINQKENLHSGKNICKWYDTQGVNLQNIQTAHTTQQQKNQTTQSRNMQKTLKRHF